MKKAKSNGGFNYKEAIIAEDKRFGGKDYRARQKKVVAGIMEDLKNNEEGGQETMTVKGGVKTKTKVATKKVVPLKVDIVKQEQKAISILSELKSSINCNNIKLELAQTKASYCSFVKGNRIIFGIRYGVNGKIGIYFKITEKEFTEHLPTFKGSYINQFAEYVLPSEKDVLKFKPLAELAVQNIPKPKPVAKVVVKKAVKKNKEIKRTI